MPDPIGVRGSPRAPERLADEAADVLIYLLRFCQVSGIELLSEVHAKIARNEARYPEELSKGMPRSTRSFRLAATPSRSLRLTDGRQMTQVIIQPAYGNPDARTHWRGTMLQTVPFTGLPAFQALVPRQQAELLALHPGGEARFWGATANQDKNMDRLEIGDVVLFTGQKFVRGIGEVGVTFRDEDFADSLWAPHPQRGSFRNVYTLASFQEVLIPYEEIWALPGFNAGDNFMGLRFLSEDNAEDILQGLNIEPILAQQIAEQQEQATAEALAAGTIIPAEAVITTSTSYTTAGATVFVHRAEALLVQEYLLTLDGPVAPRFRTPSGGIADIYVNGAGGPEVIEAKRSSDRIFVRQALSQLLDYAPFSPEPAARLSALFPMRPDDDSVGLLHRYGIDCIYREEPKAFTRLDAPDDARNHVRQRWTQP
jgi:hypothetical protein